MNSFNIRDALFKALSGNPEKILLRFHIDNGKEYFSLSGKRLKSDIEALGTALYHHGLKEKRIAAAAYSSYDYVLLALTSLCGNITLVPYFDKLPSEEIESIISRTSPSLIFRNDKELQGIRTLLQEGNDLLMSGDLSFVTDTVSPKTVSTILFTAGTTGRSKAVPFRQESWEPYAVEIKERLGWCEENIGHLLLMLPLFHLFGLALLAAFLCNGVPITVLSGLSTFIDDLKDVRPKTLILVPGQVNLVYQLMTQRSKEEKDLLFGNLRHIIYSGAPLSEEMKQAFEGAGIQVNSAYSLTETGGIAFDPPDLKTVKPGSSGRLFPNVKVRINNPDREGYGELLVSEEYIGVFEGYLDDPEETAKILYDGWVHTGDLGRIDEDRDLFLAGRIKNLIILSNGENVSPEKLENRIAELPGVRECLVYEEDDRLAADIVPEKEKDLSYFQTMIRAFNQQQPPYEQIAIVRLTDHLMRNAAGKLLRDRRRGNVK